MKGFVISEKALYDLLPNFSDVKIAVFGDMCVDIYWNIDLNRSELSRETPHFNLPVISERFSLGGAGNVAANFVALGCQTSLITAIGDDWRCNIYQKLSEELPSFTSDVVVETDRITPAYCKPMRRGISSIVYEGPRLDFINIKPISSETESSFIEKLSEASKKVDVIAVCDQLEFGCVTPKIREFISQLGKTVSIVVDSRDHASKYKNVILKPNEIEAGKLVKIDSVGLENVAQAAQAISQLSSSSTIITLGGDGSYYYENEASFGFATPVTPWSAVDFVGAGDSFMAGLCAAIGAKACLKNSVSVGNLAAGVTIHKLETTGTATIREIKEAFRKGFLNDTVK